MMVQSIIQLGQLENCNVL